MKNKRTILLLIFTAVMVCFTTGIFLGSKIGHTGISITPLSTQSNDSSDPNVQGKLNINTATKFQLCELPGVGEVLADNIIAYRETHGAFTDIFQLKNVKGIGDKLFANIYKLITVGE